MPKAARMGGDGVQVPLEGGEKARPLVVFFRWLAVGPIVFATLLAVGQAGIASAQVPFSADTRSKLKIDYSPWEAAVIRPVDQAILPVISTDLAYYAETEVAPPTLVEDLFWATPTVEPTATATPGPTESPSPTLAATAHSSAAPSWEPSPSAVLTNAATPAPAMTATPTRTPVATLARTPTATPTRTPTVTFTRTPMPTPTTPAGPFVFGPCGFNFRRRITVNGGSVAGSLSGFPVLVSLASDAGLASRARDDGFDIGFSASDGSTQLPHEIESFDGATGGLVAWVGLPSLSSGSNTVFYMYYGRSDLGASLEAPSRVWDSAFLGVWHLGESGRGLSGEYADSTRYGMNGQGGEGDPLSVPTRVSGRIGYGQEFGNQDGKYDLIDVGDNPILDVSGDRITLEAWVKHNLTSSPAHRAYGILNHKGWYNGYSLWVETDPYLCPSGGPPCVGFSLPGETHNLTTSTVSTPGMWHHIVATYDGASMMVFIDGALDSNVLGKTGAITAASPERDVWIGHADQPAGQTWSGEWEGQIDEVRISAAARSAAWIQTEYNNQSAPSSFYALGAEETRSSFCVP